MRSCYKCCHTDGRTHTMDDGDINDRWENFPSHDIFVLLEQAKFLLEKHRSYIGAKLGAFFENIL